MSEPKLIQAKIADVIVRDRLRRVLPDRVGALQDSLRRNGQMVPLDLVETAEGMRLISGAHRLAAMQANGSDTVTALLHPKGTFGSEAEILRREIAENFDRFDLTPLERAANIGAWREIYEAENGQIKRGPKRGANSVAVLEEVSAQIAQTFPEVVQQTLGLSRRAIFLALRIATVAPELRDALAAHPVARHQNQLLELAEQTPERQARVVAILTGQPALAETVPDAIRMLDGMPAPAALHPYEKLSSAFCRMPRKEQSRFFELHIDDINRWLAERGKAVETPVVPPMSPAVAAEHRRLIEQLDPSAIAELEDRFAAKSEAHETEVAARRVAHLPEGVVALPETAKERYRRAVRVRLEVEAGTADPFDAVWLGRYENTAEYRGQRAVHEDFGDAYLS